MDNRFLPYFRFVAILEGFSYLSFGITVPLKKMMQLEMPNKIIGWIHGVLFIVYCLLLLRLFMDKHFTFKETFLLFIVSLLPFGTFWAEKKYLRRHK